MDLGIEGKVALVTAGSKGLGRATALALAAEGVRVMLSGRDPATLEATRARGGGGRCLGRRPRRGRDRSRRAGPPGGGHGRAVRRAGHPGRQRRRPAARTGARPRRCGPRGRAQRQPAHLGAAGARGAAPHAVGGLGPDLLHHVVHRHAGGTGAGALQHGPHGAVGVDQDGRQRPRLGVERDHPQHGLPGPARHRPHEAAGRRRGDGRPGGLRRRRGVPVLGPGRLRQRFAPSWSTAGRRWRCRGRP